MAEIIITIDGPAGVGKTTLAKILAKRLGFKYFDTGAMYRALALIIYEKNISLEQTDLIEKVAKQLPITMSQNKANFQIFLDNRDISGLIREPKISMLASTISQTEGVRKAFWEKQRKWAKEAKRSIFEGRDMGTIVFPNATLKFFLTASPEVRAHRRLKQLKAQGKEAYYEKVYNSLLERDKQDTKRLIAPMQPAQNAIVINTNNMDIESSVSLMYKHITNKLEVLSMEKTAEEEKTLLNEPQALDQLYKKTIKNPQPGKTVAGKVIQIGKEYAMVDIGFKTEGAISLEEFMDKKGNLSIRQGDIVEVLFQGINTKDRNISLSRKKAVEIISLEKVKHFYQKGAPINGEITAWVRGGFTVDIGIPAFLPASQADIKPLKNYDNFIGKTYSFRIIDFDNKLQKVILSRRLFLEEKRQRQRQKTLSRLKEGAIVYGYIKSIRNYGIIVDLGGIGGFLHVRNLSWTKTLHPADRFEIGDRIKVKVLKFDREKEMVSLGMKQLTPDLWEKVSKNYPIGMRVKGKVTNLVDYGAFVKIKEGVEGLIHISQMSWSKYLKHPSEVLSVGDRVETIILEINEKKRRLSLGLKQTDSNPWKILEKKYPVGSVVEGKIKNITDFGIFIELIEGIEGLIHISDISWSKKVEHPRKLYKKGEKIKVKILEIDKGSQRVALGIKQLKPDPWNKVIQKFPIGSTVSGKISHISNFGLFVEVESAIEGLVHISEISHERIKNLAEKFKVGEKIKAKVIKVNLKERKLALSIKQIEEEEEKSSWQKYMSGEKGIKLGDLVKIK
jgi:small subunit ribosomal protein S1